jgi:PAN domain
LSFEKEIAMHIRHLIIASAFFVASGITGPASAQFQVNTDMPGDDYRSFDLNGGAELCHTTCVRERQCQAWTFVRAGIQGPSARCWLKTMKPRPVANSCCTSGLANRTD